MGLILDARWNLHRLEAEREAVIARQRMLATYRDRLLALEQANLGHFGEAWLWEHAHGGTCQELALLDHRLSQLCRFERPVALEGTLPPRHSLRVGRTDATRAPEDEFPVQLESDQRRIQAAMAAAQRRIAGLAQLTQDDVTAIELKRAKLELAVFEAERRLSQEMQTAQACRYQVYRSLASSNVSETRSVSSVDRTEVGSAIYKEMEPELVSLFNARAEGSGKQELAKCRIELLKYKLARLLPLRKIGYVTWKEVAATERDLARLELTHSRLARNGRSLRWNISESWQR